MSDFNNIRLLSYYAPTSCTQKPKLMGKSGQFTYTSILPLTCSSLRCKCGI
jgi:hypothetical protein